MAIAECSECENKLPIEDMEECNGCGESFCPACVDSEGFCETCSSIVE